MIDILNLFPAFYKDILEIEELAATQNAMFNNLEIEFQKALNNQFINTCDVNYLKKYESLFNIINTSDDIEFRRERLLNRMAMNIPFTLRGLKQKLDKIIGPDNYNIRVDYDNQTLYIESQILSQVWANETYITVNNIKPANIVFINKPLIQEGLLLNETLSYSERNYNYKLGVWILGSKPFMSLKEKGIIKMAESKSINENLLNDLRKTLKDKVSYIKINNSIKIQDFLKLEIIDNEIIIEYAFKKNANVTEITKVEVFDSNDRNLSTINLYVPVIEDIELKHIFRIKEGV